VTLQKSINLHLIKKAILLILRCIRAVNTVFIRIMSVGRLHFPPGEHGIFGCDDKLAHLKGDSDAIAPRQAKRAVSAYLPI